MAFPFPPNNAQPIPNPPFYYPEGSYLYGPSGPLIVGSGFQINNATGTISVSGGGSGAPTILAGTGISVVSGVGTVTIANTGILSVTAGAGISVSVSAGNLNIVNTAPAPGVTGTVTQVNSGTGLTGGPITNTGTLSLAPVGSISPGTYTNATVTVDTYGRVTSASPGSGLGSLIQATAPLSVNASLPQTITVSNASTASSGVVQLNTSTNSTSTTQAATPSAVKTAFDLATTAAANSATALSAASSAASAAASAQTTANTANATATTALANAGTAQTTANTAIANAIAAQATANAAVPRSSFSLKGQLLAGTGSSTYVSLNPGINGQTLVACSACSSGLTWVSQPVAAGTVISVATGPGLLGGPITTSGTISLAPSGVIANTYTYANVSVDAYGRVTAAGNGVPPIPCACITAKGTLITGVASGVPVALPVGANGRVLTACSLCPEGITWVTNTASAIPCSCITAKGALISGTAPGTVSSLSVGVNGYVLTADSTCTSGLKWAVAASPISAATPTVEGSVFAYTDGVANFGTALGYEALNTTVTGPGNVALGTSTGCSLTTGQLNTFVGSGAGCDTTTGNNNIALGAQSLFAHTTGIGNIALGNLAGLNLTTESNNVFLGPYAGQASCDNNVYLAAGDGTLRMRVNECGAYDFGGVSYGTVGQVLTSGGPTTTPTWTTIAVSGGTVTSITAGTGLNGGTITTTGTIALTNTAVTPGTYNFATLTVDQQGRLTAASTGTPCSGTVTSVATGTGLTGGPISTTGTIALDNTTVTSGSYTNTSLTVDAQGRLTAAASGVAPVTAITGTAPIAVTAGTSPVVSIAAGTTSASGAVQLFDGVNSTSTALALTAAQGKVLQDQITTLLTAPGINFAGTIDASTGLVLSVTTVGTTAGYTVGAVLPAASATTTNTYVIVTNPGTFTPPGGSSTVAGDGDWFLASETAPGVYAWQFLNVGFDAPYSSTSTAGIICLSTNALAQTGTDTLTAITPAVGAATYVFNSDYAAKGDLLSATAANTPVALTVGTNGQFLVACATAATGLCWLTLPAVANATPTVAGVVLGCTLAANTALGCNALLVNASSGNTAVGDCALTATSTGDNNTGIGSRALLSNTTGVNNVAVGARTLSVNTTGGFNVAVGRNALCSNTVGCCNIAIGYDAGCLITTGYCNIAIGPSVQVAAPTGCCQLAIGFSATCNWLTGDSSKNIQPGAGVKDCTGSVGTAGQYLCSTGTALKWVTGMGDTPVGTVNWFAATTSPLGWLVADGSAVSRTLYSDLFGKIGTTYGVGDGSTTFNLPDLRGQFIRGWDAAGGTPRGCDTGRAFGSTQQDAIQCHQHVFPWGENGTACFGQTTQNIYRGIATATDLDNRWYYTNNGTDFDGVLNPAGVIGCETRPMNVAMLPCIKWQVTTAPTSCGIPCSCITAKGTIITGDAPDNPVSLPVGIDGQALVACAACPTGLFWTTPAVPVSPATPTVAGTVLGRTNATNAALGCNAFLTGCGADNVAIGRNSLTSTTTGYQNVAVGLSALCSVTTGLQNTSVGSTTLCSFTTGCANDAFGALALSSFTSGCYNASFGGYSLFCLTSGNFNTAIGHRSMTAATTGQCNTALGYLSGKNITTGTQNVAIGYDTTVANATGACQLAIGFAAGQNWITGDCSKNIQPGAGIRDCSGNLGTVNQVLCSNGTHLQWANVGALPPGRVVSGIVAAGASVCMDNIAVSLSTGGNRSFGFNTVSGTATVTWTTNYVQCGMSGSGPFQNQTLTTAFRYFDGGYAFGFHGACQSATICYGLPVTAAYNIVGIIGSGYANNVISITRIV